MYPVLFHNHYLFSPKTQLHYFNDRIKIYLCFTCLIFIKYIAKKYVTLILILYAYFAIFYRYLIIYFQDFTIMTGSLILYLLLYQLDLNKRNKYMQIVNFIKLTFYYNFTIRLLSLTTKFEKIFIILFKIIIKIQSFYAIPKNILLFISCFSYKFLDQIIYKTTIFILSIRVRKMTYIYKYNHIYLYFIRTYILDHFKQASHITYMLYIKNLSITSIFLHYL